MRLPRGVMSTPSLMLDQGQMLVMLAEQRGKQAIVVENESGEVAIFQALRRPWRRRAHGH